jgi:transposase
MPAKFKLTPEQTGRVRAAMARLTGKREYERALCVWLPAALGLTMRQVAQVLGWPASAVANMQHRYRRLGEAAFRDRRFTPPPQVAGGAEGLRSLMQQARNPEELLRFLAVRLRLALGLSHPQVAAALGRSVAYVVLAEKMYAKGGPSALRFARFRGAMPPESAGEVAAVLRRARSVEDVRRALCVFLRLVLRLSPAQVAAAVGLKPQTVSRLSTLYLKRGAVALRTPGRGGARRHLLTHLEEAELLRGLRESPANGWPHGVVKFSAVQEAVEELAGRPVKPSTVHAILHRHGWGRESFTIVPFQARLPKDSLPTDSLRKDSLPES